jgi:hypothetical protein
MPDILYARTLSSLSFAVITDRLKPKLLCRQLWLSSQAARRASCRSRHTSFRRPVIADRIVDGGYFENYGALSAKELALAVHAIQPDLAPFVLVISNDPDDLLDPANDSDTAAKARRTAQRAVQLKKARAAVSDSEPVTDLVTPVTTVANTRTAHGTLGVDQLRSSLREALPGCDVRMIHVRVWPQPEETSNRSRAVSMSWWLSSSPAPSSSTN